MNRMARWAFLVHTPNLSGGTLVIFQHAVGLAALGEQVTLVWRTRPSPDCCIWFPEHARLNWKSFDDCRDETFDIAVATWWETLFELHQLRFSRALYFVQSVESRFYEEPLLRQLAASTYALPLPVVTVADWISSYLEHNFGRTSRVVLNGVRKDLLGPQGPSLASRRRGHLRVLVEGPIAVPFKNVSRTIDLCHRAGVAEVWLLTSAPITRFPGADRVLGAVPMAQLGAVYRSCDVLVKLSRVEGMFGPPLEQFLCGGTAVTYDVSGYDHILCPGFNGLVLPLDDERGVVEALKRLKRDPSLLARLQQKASETALAWPDWPQASRAFLTTVQELLTHCGEGRGDSLNRPLALLRQQRAALSCSSKPPGQPSASPGTLWHRIRRLAPRTAAAVSAVKAEGLFQSRSIRIRLGRWLNRTRDLRPGTPDLQRPDRPDGATAAVRWHRPPPAGTPWVRVIVVNYNGGDLIQSCLDHLALQTLTNFEVVVVDNGSCDGSAVRLHLPDERFRLIEAGRNLGFAAANNLGARDSRAPWLATLNPDAFAEPDWLQRLYQATCRYPQIAMFGSTQIDHRDPTILDGCGDVCSIYGIPWRGGYRYPLAAAPETGEAFAPCAAAALYRRAEFEDVGGFDDAFFCYLEDVDLGYRLRLRGHRCLQLAEARVRHLGSAISGRASRFTLYHSYRNRLWLVFKDSPFPLILLTLPLHLVATIYLLLRTRNLQDVGPCFEGLWAGLRGLPGVVPARRAVQRRRVASNLEMARAMTWSVAKLRNRSIDLRHR